MKKDAAIAPAIELVENMISRVPWEVKAPEGYEEQLADKITYLNQVMDDMEHTFYDFIRQASSFNHMGFSVHEKVFRERRKANGSKYNDGYVGIRALPPRGQDTISKWKFSKKNNKLKGLYQKVAQHNEFSQGMDFIKSSTESREVFIPRYKFLHFRNNPEKDSPIGVSPLVGCHTAWRYKVSYQEMEASGVVQETNGLKVLYIPAKYMAEDASEDDKRTANAFGDMLTSMHLNKSSGMMLPLVTDERGNKMFELDIQNITGTSSFDIDAIISRYTLEILTSLFADFLTLGSKGGGSFSLAESKISIIQQMIEARLNEIKGQLNHDLVRHLFELNGWSTEVMPYFDYGDVRTHSLDEISKWVQRIKATGMLPRNQEVVNWVLSTAGVPYRIPKGMSEEEFDELMGESTSRSGDSLNTPSGGMDGTAKSVDGEDNSISNTENA